MTLFQALIMGLVQGLTEYLPVSSSAHLMLVPQVLHFPDPGAGFTAVIQIGTVAAVIIFFWRDLGRALKGWAGGLFDPAQRNTLDSRMGWAVFLATIPVVIIGLAFKHQIKSDAVRSMNVLVIDMIGMALVMWVSDALIKKRRNMDSVKPVDGLLPGALQCLALLPGMSRSGSTIVGAFFEGFDRAAATRFSFLMSVPSVLGAGLYEIYDARKELHAIGVTDTVLATLVAFVVGYASIAFMLSYVAKSGLKAFVIYRVALGLLLIFALGQGFLHNGGAHAARLAPPTAVSVR